MKKTSLLIITLMICLCVQSIILYAQSKKTFTNPILAGFYPDPSNCKVSGDYYIVNSTFAYFPAIPVFHSKDLVHWKLIGHVFDKPEKLNLDNFGVSRAIFAPAIRYHNEIFYVTCTLVDGGGNFITYATNPEGPWSKPKPLREINGIDPSLFFDDDGKVYITYNGSAPDDKPLYDGHRTIRIVQFDIDNLKIISEPKILINGGVDFSKKPIWIEGPHIYKINGTYYLTAAEGGTAEGHSQVILRSDKVDGPYSAYENNPILTQRDLNPKRKNPVTCTGHADFVQTDTGDWWAMFLGCRPYEPFEKNYYNTGRETFLVPVKWKDRWPIINPDFKEVQYSYPSPIESADDSVDIPYNGNFLIRDEFDKENLHPSWIFLRTPHEKWYDLSKKPSYLSINLKPETCSGKLNPSFIARRQQHSIGYGETSLLFNTKNENEKAGLIIFQDETHFYYLCKSVKNNSETIELYAADTSSKKTGMKLISSKKLNADEPGKELIMKIEVNGKYFSFYYGYKSDKLKMLKNKVDATALSINRAWGFVGNVYAMYATSLGNVSDNTACYNWFEYKGDDKIYR